jgi:hypothetical protein
MILRFDRHGVLRWVLMENGKMTGKIIVWFATSIAARPVKLALELVSKMALLAWRAEVRNVKELSLRVILAPVASTITFVMAQTATVSPM